MKRPSPRPPPGRLRPWLVPLLGLALLLTLRQRSFDADALRADLAAGRVEAALERLAGCREGELDPGLAAVRWWPAAARADRLAQLRSAPPGESASGPTLVEPLATWRAPPTHVRLREPAAQPLHLAIESLELGLPVTSLEIPAGTQELPLEVTFIPGTTCVLRLLDERGGPVALSAFQLLSGSRAEEQGILLATAHALGGGDPGGELLASLVALHCGLYAEGSLRLLQLEHLPAYATVARELRAMALFEQGLDRSARTLLDG